jgi:hypothetical protein
MNSRDVVSFIVTQEFFVGGFIGSFILMAKIYLPWDYGKYDEKAIYSINVYSSIIASMFFISATVILWNMIIEGIEKNLHFYILVEWKDVIFTLIILIIGRFLRKILKSCYKIRDTEELTNIIFLGGILSSVLIFVIDSIYLPSIIALLIGRLVWFDIGIVESVKQIINIKRYIISFILTIVTLIILIITIMFLHASSDSVVKVVSGFVFMQLFLFIDDKGKYNV